MYWRKISDNVCSTRQLPVETVLAVTSGQTGLISHVLGAGELRSQT